MNSLELVSYGSESVKRAPCITPSFQESCFRRSAFLLGGELHRRVLFSLELACNSGLTL